jgi:hypothetical protein
MLPELCRRLLQQFRAPKKILVRAPVKYLLNRTRNASDQRRQLIRISGARSPHPYGYELAVRQLRIGLGFSVGNISQSSDKLASTVRKALKPFSVGSLRACTAKEHRSRSEKARKIGCCVNFTETVRLLTMGRRNGE